MAWCGPTDHGITRFGRELFRSAVAAGFAGTPLAAETPDALLAAVGGIPAGTRLVHLQVNDWLFGDARAAAQDRVVELAGRLRDRGIALTMTLHDLPHPEVPAVLYRRRTDSYAAFAAVADGLVVSSRHEAQLLATAVSVATPTATLPAVRVIELPIPADGAAGTIGAAGAVGAAVAPCGDGMPTVGVFGFRYPGKGHAEVIDELGGSVPAVRLVAIGRASAGHEELDRDLASAARSGGMDWLGTGFVADDDVEPLLRAVDVPVAPAAHVSASGSLNSWIAAGRRPLALAGRYTREFDDRHPGCVQLYEPGELRMRVTAALADPSSTWLGPGAAVGSGPAEVALQYLAWWRTPAARC